ncbi:MAG: hypothetical protein JJU06_01025 [Ectothiorhodospiraceae bacterium]|nr:hypothetical protein [Ectothiorhodospiraceae bacterium]MCH8506695.1 hypothetical protein [Ectothiorhodospiraceae bacterium]
MYDAIISGYNVEADSEEWLPAYEELVISFVKMNLKYIPSDDSNKTLSALAVGFDTATNRIR